MMAHDHAKEKKKLMVLGKYTYVLPLPKTWIKQLGWRTKQALQLELRGSEIVVKDFPNK
jgi:hypothetical protein